MTKDENQELEAGIIAKIRTKKKPNNVDDFLLLVDAARNKASKEMLSVYRALMRDLVKIEQLKQEQQSLADGLASKYGEYLANTDGVLGMLLSLQREVEQNAEIEKMIEREESSQAGD